MTQFILIFMSLAVGYTFTRMNHPLAMGLTLLFQTLLIALLTGLMTSTFWFSYILFLVFLGGMLVLFIYVTSLASNEMFSISSQALIFGSLSIGLILFCSLFNDPLLWTSSILPDPFNLNDLTTECQSSSVPELLIKLYHAPSSLLTLLLVIYLFLTLIAVVTITNIFEGPLRSKN